MLCGLQWGDGQDIPGVIRTFHFFTCWLKFFLCLHSFLDISSVMKFLGILWSLTICIPPFCRTNWLYDSCNNLPSLLQHVFSSRVHPFRCHGEIHSWSRVAANFSDQNRVLAVMGLPLPGCCLRLASGFFSRVSVWFLSFWGTILQDEVKPAALTLGLLWPSIFSVQSHLTLPASWGGGCLGC